MPEVDQASVNRYWENVKSSILGPYMMDDFGFPVSAGDFRFQAESMIVRRLLGGVKRNGAVLDLGCGAGYWAEEFARSFSRVVAEPFQALRIVGRLTYWCMCLGSQGIKRIPPPILGIEFPSLENHFFTLGTCPVVKE